MTQYYLALISLPVIATGLLVLRIMISVKNPMYIGDDKKGNKKAKKIAKDTITVYSFEIARALDFIANLYIRKERTASTFINIPFWICFA